MQVKALLFDLDGTILDSVGVILASFRQAFERMGLEFDEPYVRAQLGIPLEAQGKLFGGERAEEFVEHYRRTKAYRNPDSIGLFPGAEDTLRALKSRGLRLGIVTSKSTRSTRLILEAAQLLELFEVVVTADHVTQHKPHPEPILKAIDELGVYADEAAYVGDATFDVEAAAGAGVAMIGVSWGAGLREALEPGCVRVVDSWDELARIEF